MRVAIDPALLTWACHRASKQPQPLTPTFLQVQQQRCRYQTCTEIYPLFESAHQARTS